MGKAKHSLNAVAANGVAGVLTPAQAGDVARWVIAETQAVFLRGLADDYARTGREVFKPDLATASLTGYCGFAQCFIDLTLKDCGFTAKPVALQTLPHGGYPHVMLTAEFETTAGKKVFLFDPTFRQFCVGQAGEPGAVLAGLPGGKALRAALLKDGFVELDGEKAVTYLSAFNKGKPPVASRASAMKFFAQPKLSEMNNWFKREFYVGKGFIDPTVKRRPPVP